MLFITTLVPILHILISKYWQLNIYVVSYMNIIVKNAIKLKIKHLIHLVISCTAYDPYTEL